MFKKSLVRKPLQLWIWSLKSLKSIISYGNNPSKQFFEILCYDKPRNWFTWHSPCESRLHSASENVCHPEVGRFVWTTCFVQCTGCRNDFRSLILLCTVPWDSRNRFGTLYNPPPTIPRYSQGFHCPKVVISNSAHM